MSQTSYDAAPAIAYAGMLADMNEKVTDSYVNEDAAAMPFGIGVMRGTSDRQMKVPSLATGEFLGITVHTHAMDSASLAGSLGIPTKRYANVIDQGRVYAVPEEAVTKGDPVYMRFADGIGDATKVQKGAFRKSTDSGTAVRVRGAKWQTSASAGAPAVIELEGTHDAAVATVSLSRSHVANADAGVQTTFFEKTPPDRFFVIDDVEYINPTGLVAHASNNALIQVIQGSTVAAGWNTDADGAIAGTGAAGSPEGTIAADTPVALTLAALAARVVPPNTRINLVVTEAGTTTVPAGTAIIHGHYL